MQKIIGPELLWLFLCAVVAFLAKKNATPPPRLDGLLEHLFLYIPLAALLSFALWYFPMVVKSGLLLRIWIAGLVGGHFALNRGLAAHSQQGPGIGTAYIIGILLLIFALVAGTVAIKLLPRK